MLVLASHSPRRQVLLRYMVPEFDILGVDIEEVAPRTLPIEDAVQVIARKKALAASRKRPDDWILAADTVVAIGDRLVGKARTEGEARSTLAEMTSTTHRVWTGVALAWGDRAVDAAHAVSAVHMDRLPVAVLDTYVTSGQWKGKAGGYGIQDPLLRPFLHLQSGPWSNVVGLPLAVTYDLLRRNDVACRDPPNEAWLQEHNPFEDQDAPGGAGDASELEAE